MTHRLSPDRSETRFSDFKPGLTALQAQTEANRCLFCSDAPCVQACPTSIDIPQFIRKIGTGNLRGAARTILTSNVMGMSCARVCPVEVLCAGACVLNHLHQEPVAIGKLQRFATDPAIDQGWRFEQAGPDSGKRVALIGAGPASLACAHELRRHGHQVTIYERRALPGGLSTTGVAPHKMRADRALDEVAWVLGIGGIELRCETEVGSRPTLAELEAGYDAVFVGVGLGADSRLGLPGEQLPGVAGAVAWIEQLKLGKVELAGVNRCVVIGGGNTALDAVREARKLGIPEVTLLYRGGEEKMSGYAHEWEAARIEGVRALWHAQPTAFEGKGRLQRLLCRTLDEHKVPIAGSDFAVAADLALIAIGQARLVDQLQGLSGIRIEDGRLLTDRHGFTGRARWFAGGDCSNGGREVVNAAAEGKAAAQGIHAFLSGGAAGGAR